MCEHHYHYLGTELHRLSPERDREDGGVRTEERESVPRRESQSLSDARLHWHWVAGNQTPGLSRHTPLFQSQTRPEGSLDRNDTNF